MAQKTASLEERHPTVERLMAAVALVDPAVNSPTALALALDESPQTITNWNTRGVSKGGALKAQGLLGVSSGWVMDGKRPMLVLKAPPEDGAEWSDIPGYAQAIGLGKGAEAQEYAETHKLKFRAESLTRKRLRPAGLAVMYGSGDSMLPRIKPGDAILFDTGDARPKDGRIFVVQWKGEIYAKRCMVLDEDVFFASDNPSGDHHWTKPKRMDAKRDPITIIGRVRWIGSWED